jgi:superfamily II DNA or RNA helicase
MTMAKPIANLTIDVTLTEHGDALIYGTLDEFGHASGLYIKQRLFAWHEASFYGTELELRKVRDVELIVLPAEFVIPFFGDCRLLEFVGWTWSEAARPLIAAAPLLLECVKEKKYAPSYAAYRSGSLQWIWADDALNAPLRVALGRAGADDGFMAGLRAAFSAAVSDLHYGTEAALLDLRRDYPLLFAQDSPAAAGMDEQAWLIAIGWKPDDAPFRPVLQLLEPDGEDPSWRLRLALQDKREAARLVPVRLTERGELLGAWPADWSAHARERAAGWLQRLRAVLPAERLSGGGDVLGAPLDDAAAWRFLTADSKRLLEAGWEVLLPAWWEAARRRKPRLRARIGSGAESRGGKPLFGLDAILDFDWRVALGETELTEAEFAELVARNERLVRFRGEWIALDPALIDQIRKLMAGVDKSQGLTFQDVLQLHLLGDGGEAASGGPEESGPEETERIRLEVELNGHLAKLVGQIGQQAEWPKLDAPAGLMAELRAYQRDGYSWLAFLGRFGLGACLADDMGLGKTVQLIAYLLHLKEQSEPDNRLPSLIVCPTSVLGNWQKELARFAPSLNVMLHYGSRRPAGADFRAKAREADVVLTSYATAALDQNTLEQVTWAVICLDEAQNIKNAQTKQSAAVRRLPARHRIALTGTPIENRLSELWSIYDFLSPGYLGTASAFQKRFAAPIEKDRDPRRTADLQKLVKPFMLRRKKKDPAIRLDLPEKNEMKTYVHLTAEQSALYEQIVRELMERMKTLEGIERKGAILAALTQLKQVCDHPILLTKEPSADEWTSGEPQNIKALIARSSKLERLLEMVKELREEGDRCLIFTQYVGMGQLLQQVLRQELQEPVLYLNGSTSKTARDRMIGQFQSDSLPPGEQPHVFILSLKAGGVGLNLTAASHVFHFDRWWNPAVENQATDRAYRMGQTRDVQVHKFIALGTLEERIDEMLENKLRLSDDIISASEGWITELSTEELKELFTLRRDYF